MAHVIAPVSAIACADSLLFVGAANVLRIYDAFESGAPKLLSATAVLPAGESIHGIVVDLGLLALFGVREVRCHRLLSGGLQPACFARRMHCRVLCLHLEDEMIGVGLDQNSVYWLTVSPTGATHMLACSDAPLLYAMALHRCGDHKAAGGLANHGLTHRYRAVSGSAFRVVIIWDATPAAAIASGGDSPPAETRAPLWRLEGHEGAVFKVVVSKEGSWLATVSDDRRVMLWASPPSQPSPPPPPSAPPLTMNVAASQAPQRAAEAVASSSQLTRMASAASWFAHSARVWDVAFIHEATLTAAGAHGTTRGTTIHVASAGEDTLVKLWRVVLPLHPLVLHSGGRAGVTAGPPEVTLLATMRGHVGKHVWCVAPLGDPPRVCRLTSGTGAGASTTGDSTTAMAHARGGEEVGALASGGADGAIKLWPIRHLLATSTSVERPAVGVGTVGGSSGAAPSADAAAAGADEAQRLGSAVVSLPPGQSNIRALAFIGPSWAVAATGSGDVWAIRIASAHVEHLHSEPDARWSKVHACCPPW